MGLGSIIPNAQSLNSTDTNSAIAQGGFLGWLQGAWADVTGKVSNETQAEIDSNTYQGILNAGGSIQNAQSAVDQVNYQISQSNTAASQSNLSEFEKVGIGIAIALAVYAWIFARASKG